MIIYPAIDIRNGQVVRLLEGDPQHKTVYHDSPVTVAEDWRALGAQWVHIVNLDGALDEAAVLWEILKEIKALGLKIQFGGGLRTAKAVSEALSAGVDRAVIGTAAVENPDFAAQLVSQHGAEHIVVALDARGGKVATHGWQSESAWTAIELGQTLYEKGVRHALYTDISRDGMLSGVNVAATKTLASETDLQVVASGGVRSIEDVAAFLDSAIAGIILGKALYEGLLDLKQALRLADG